MDIKKILAVIVMWGGYGMAADAAGTASDEFEMVKTPEDPVDAILTRLATLEAKSMDLFHRLSTRADKLGIRTANLEATGAMAKSRMDFHLLQINSIEGDISHINRIARNLEQSTAALEGSQATTTRKIIDQEVEDARLRTLISDLAARLEVIGHQQAALARRNQAALARHKERLDGHDARLDAIERHIAILYNSDQAHRAAIAPIPDLQRTVEILQRQVAGLQQQMRDWQLQFGVRARK